MSNQAIGRHVGEKRFVTRRIRVSCRGGMLMSLIVALFLLLAGFPAGLAPHQESARADIIVKNARIWTADSTHPWVEALAVRGNRIMAVGDNGSIAQMSGAGTVTIDAHGQLALPGFNDAHTHFLSGSLGLFEVDLNGARSLQDVRERVKRFAEAHPNEPWIRGAGWEYSITPGKRLPTRFDLDAAVRDRPVFLEAYDGHTGWANTRALAVAGVTANSRFEGYGEVVIDTATGEPTGAFKESAQTLIRRMIPEPTREKKLAALREGLRMAARLGITSFQNASGNPDEFGLYEELSRRGELTARVSMAMSIGQTTTLADLRKYAEMRRSFPGPLLRVGAVKILLDGVIESHTAAMIQPYSDLPSSSGTAAFSAEALNRLVSQADAAGLQVYIHAIGDRAVRMALDAYEKAARENGTHDARYRIEHIETIDASDVPRFARIGVIASMEPIHADPGTNDVWEPAVGPERARRGFAWRMLELAGARLVFSTDWPATISVDPIRGIHNAVNRRTIDGQPPGGWIPEQRVSVDTAVRAFTQGGAFASFEEKEKGSLSEGKLADVILLDRDIFKIDPMEIGKTKVVLNIFDGKVIYRR